MSARCRSKVGFRVEFEVELEMRAGERAGRGTMLLRREGDDGCSGDEALRRAGDGGSGDLELPPVPVPGPASLRVGRRRSRGVGAVVEDCR